MDALLAVQIANLAVKGFLDAGISWAAFRATQENALAEGRVTLNAEELRALVAKSQDAINKL